MIRMLITKRMIVGIIPRKPLGIYMRLDYMI